MVDSPEELAEMFNAPLEKWRVFCTPARRGWFSATSTGRARVLGGAGTGKTVVAMHRARYLAPRSSLRANDRILFTTYTHNLASNIKGNLDNLCGPEPGAHRRDPSAPLGDGVLAPSRRCT